MASVCFVVQGRELVSITVEGGCRDSYRIRAKAIAGKIAISPPPEIEPGSVAAC